MADNVKVDEGSGPAIATEDVGGVHYQKTKVYFGGDGTATTVDAGTPFPSYDKAVEEALEAAIALLGTIDGDTGNLAAILTRLTEIEEDTDRLAAIETSVGLLDNAISGSEMQVDVVTLPGIVGSVAHGSADSGAPVKIGGRAETSMQAAEADGDRVDALFDKFGRIASIAAPLDNRVSGSVKLENATSTDVIAKIASTGIVVTDLEVINGDATVGTWVEIFDGETMKWQGFAGPLGGGFAKGNPDGLWVGTANTAVKAKCLTTSSETAVNISGYKIPA